MAVDMTKLVNGDALLYALKGIKGKVDTAMTGKVDKVTGKGLSTNDYTTEEKNKLAGVDEGANNYVLPAATDAVLGGVKTGANITNVGGVVSINKANVTSALGYTPPEQDTTYNEVTTKVAGLMSTDDKTKLNGIAENANNYVLPTAGAGLGGVKTTSNVSSAAGFTAAPIIDGVVYYKDTNTTYEEVSQDAAGLMTADDKKKLDAFADAGTYATVTYVGQQIANAGHVTKTIVTALPSAEEAKDNVIYMIKKTSGSGDNLYDEYMLIDGKLEKIGDTETKITTLSNADIEEILAQVQ